MYKLYIGNETHMSFKQASLLVKQLVKDISCEYISLDAEKTKGITIIETLSSTSLFSNTRVIFLKRFYKNKERDTLIPFLLQYLERESQDHIIIWEDQKVSAITKYVKYFKSKNQIEEYNKLTKTSFLKYAKEVCKENNITLDTELLNLICQYSNFDTQRLDNNIQKLKLIEKDNLTKDDLRNIVENTLEEDIWKLLDEMNANNGKPLDILENIFKQGIDPRYIFPMIARNLRLITLIKYLTSTNSSYSEIASKLKIPPFTIKPLIDASNMYDWEKIKRKYEKLSNLDYEIKIGKIEPKLGLTLFCTIP